MVADSSNAGTGADGRTCLVGQAGMNVRQPQYREAQNDCFSSRAMLIVMHDGFEADARVGNPNRAVFPDRQRHVLCWFKHRHDAVKYALGARRTQWIFPSRRVAELLAEGSQPLNRD